MDRPGPRADPAQPAVGRSGMSRLRSWWDGLPDPERFRIYTRGSEVTTVIVAGAIAVSVREVWLILALVIVAAAGSLVLESRPELSTWMAVTWRTPARRVGIGLLAAVAGATALVVHTSGSDRLAADAGAVGVFAVVVATMTVVTFLTHRWWIAVGLGLLAGPAYQDTPATWWPPPHSPSSSTASWWP